MAHIRFHNSCNCFLRKVWPIYRSKSEGRIEKLRGATRRQRINTVQPREFNRVKAFSTDLRSHNSGNCIYLNSSRTQETPGRHAKQETSFWPIRPLFHRGQPKIAHLTPTNKVQGQVKGFAAE